MKLIPNRKIHVPKDLGNVTTYDPTEEVDPVEADMNREGVDAVWTGVENLYRTGVYPAISFCLRRHGKIVLKRAIGHARGNGPEDGRDAEKVLVTPETPICQFSASKAVTAMLMHLLVERGEINLMDPVSHYIPEFAARGKENTTIYHILAHQGGIPVIPDNVDRDLMFDWDGVISYLCGLKPSFTGGRKMAYHAITGGFIVGEIIRRVTGNDIREFLAEMLQKPLGLRYFNFGVSDDEMDRVAWNYSTGLPVLFPISAIVKKALTVDWDEVVQISNTPRFLQTIVPAGNLVATADEMSQFFQLLLNGGELNGVRIFEPLTIRRAIMEADDPQIDQTMLLPMRYSAGMMLGNAPVGLYGPYTRKAYGHLGFINIMCWADPDRDISVALVTTGKSLIGTHLAPLAQLLASISWFCRSDDPLGQVGDFVDMNVVPVKDVIEMVFSGWW